MVSPAEFFPVAEEMGLIVDIGTFVLREACMECAKWPEDVRVAVNLSPIQFRRGAVARVICEALAAAKLPVDLPRPALIGACIASAPPTTAMITTAMPLSMA